MRINRIPRLPGRAELPTAPSLQHLLARALRSLGLTLRRAVITFHIREARNAIALLDEVMRQDRITLATAREQKNTAAADAIVDRQLLDSAQRAFLSTHLERLRHQRASLGA